MNMRDHTPQTIRLKDYAPPEYLIDTVDLRFELDEENTRVSSRLTVRRNPAAQTAARLLELNGETLRLESIAIDGVPLTPERYRLTDDSLVLPGVPDVFTLDIVTCINPKANTAYEGLYLSNGMFCTQCEAQGFRRITYFADRPDVMACYTVEIVAVKACYPVLLSNGNRIAAGDVDATHHRVKWQDPVKKPSYLFALVAGDLACLEDRYITVSGHEVTLQIYTEPRDLDKCGHAMRSLQNAMRWDEECYGREYDLALYMIVAVSHFNMGAMENKGLNIFNTSCVLARQDTATDQDYERIEGVIAHEYFHNWTGNRITCRDWFQLSLKEGLTVFRDQQFSADMGSRAVKRIEDVALLRERQFAEDAGPLAHPVRPDAYIEINNFYTLTVYEKGAEVIRMQHTLLGAAGFRKGMDLYFARHDGQAVTCDDFVRCMEDANGVDLGQFRQWYSQAGTPELTLDTSYDAAAQCFTLTMQQHTPATPGQPDKQPLHIPFAIGLIGPDGQDLPLQLSHETEAGTTTRVLEITQAVQRYDFVNVPSQPVVSALRNFSAPVKLRGERPHAELAFLLTHDSDPFSRWDAGQELACAAILQLVNAYAAGQALCSNVAVDLIIEAYASLFTHYVDEPALLAVLLGLPAEAYVADRMVVIDPQGVQAARVWLKQTLAHAHAEQFVRWYQQLKSQETGSTERVAMARRQLKNVCLGYVAELNDAASQALVVQQFHSAPTMTDQFAALAVLVDIEHPQQADGLAAFYAQWRDEALVIDKWFRVQALGRSPATLDRVCALVGHEAFDLDVPNRVRALIGAFCSGNAAQFHRADGAGYAFLADHVIALNVRNPQIAARILVPLTQWRRYDATRQPLMQMQLQRIAETPGISKDVYEMVAKSLA